MISMNFEHRETRGNSSMDPSSMAIVLCMALISMGSTMAKGSTMSMGSTVGMGSTMEIGSTLGIGSTMVHTFLSVSECSLDPKTSEGKEE